MRQNKESIDKGPEPPVADTAITGTDEITAQVVDFSETARILFSAGSVTSTMSRVLSIALATVDCCEFAGIFLFQGDGVVALHSDPGVADAEAVRYMVDEDSPSIGSFPDDTVHAAHVADDERFSAEALARGMRGLLALPLSANKPIGGLNLYGRGPQAFGVMDRARGFLVASLAGLALSSAVAFDDVERRAANLHAALMTREVIGQAQGILMERELITADQAFDLLRRASQHLNLKLSEVAQTLVETGERPETGLRPGSPIGRGKPQER